MKRIIGLVLSAALWVGLLAGCGGGGSADGPSGQVVTNGSTSMELLVGGMIEAFREENPGVVVTYDPTGSGSGIEAAANGSADFGLSSRALKDSEKEKGLTETVVAKDGIALVVNPANTVSDLTVEQIAAIATGQVTNWSQVGGQDGPIVFVGREAGSGTRGAFEEIVGVEDACIYSQELTSTGAVKTAVASTPGAIGYVSLASVDESVKALTIGGAACTEAAILDGSYAIQRPFVFVMAESTALSEAARAFLDFATSPDSAWLYELAGVVPAFS